MNTAPAPNQAGNVSLPADEVVSLDNPIPLPLSDISVPASGVVLSGEVSIEGIATDDNFERSVLHAIITEGSTIAINTSTEAQTERGNWGLWDTQAHEEGTYTLHLQAINIDGLADSARVEVTVDNTPPMAEIDSPASGTRVSGRLEISGTATDAHLASYRIEVGPGLDPAAAS